MMLARRLDLIGTSGPRMFLRRPLNAATLGPLTLIAAPLFAIRDQAQIRRPVGRCIGKAAQVADRIG